MTGLPLSALGDLTPSTAPGPEEIIEKRESLATLLRRIGGLTPIERQGLALVANGKKYGDSRSAAKVTDNAVQRARRKLAAPERPLERRVTGVLLVDRSAFPTERDAIRQARLVRPGCEVLEVRRRKLRGTRVVAPQGRASADGKLGRPVWAVTVRVLNEPRLEAA